MMNPVNSSLDWDHEDITVEAILHEQLDVSSQQVPIQVCQAQLKRSADRLSVGAHGDRLVYGNCRGLGLLEKVIELRRDVRALLSKVETLTMKDLKREEANKESAQEVQALKGKVTQLSQSSKDYLKIRRRFITVYERDFKGRKDPKSSDAIQGGNFKAHGGDAVADAMVFDEDGSLDKTVYEELYGLQHTKVLEWNSKRMRHNPCI